LPSAEARLESLISPYVGIVSDVTEILRGADDGRFACFTARPASNSRLVGAAIDEGGGGRHLDRRRARSAALAETAERYSASFVPAEAVLATAAGLGSAAIEPASFALFSDEQYATPGFPFARFDAATPVRWVDGVDLADGRSVLLPAQLVYLPRAGSDETLIGYATSNGLAAGWSREEAALAGLLELVERDAFVLAWSNRLSLPLLDPTGDPELESADRRLFVPTGLKHAGVDASVFFGLPVVIGVVRGPAGEVGALGVGGAGAPTVGEAWTKALVEAFATREYVRDRVGVDPGLVPGSAEAVETFDDHVHFYAHAEAARRAEFLTAATEHRSARDVPALCGATPGERLRESVQRLRAGAVDVYAVDVTSTDLAALGLSVVRVVCPQLCALDVPHRARYQGGTRLYRAAFDASLVPAPFRPGDLNPDPHPFP
jgi:ribosomal protein S12 methylthiotransferase accessory factor